MVMQLDTSMIARRTVMAAAYKICLIETVCSIWLRQRLYKLQIRELMQERNRSQGAKDAGNYKTWGILFCLCFVCLISCVCGIVFLPDICIVYPVSVVSPFAFCRISMSCCKDNTEK